MMGSERRSMVMTEEEKTLTAYHEAGHAIVTINEDAAHPIHKATIIPRGRALGMVMQLPERDELSQTREQLHAQLAIAMGGRVAEEIIFGEDKVTTGASSDIEQATQRARAMVMTEEEKTLTAYHEAGHAIVTINEDAAHPIHKATIIPRGRALGMVMQLPERDELSQTREQLHAQLAIAMGGRVAEEIIFGEDKVTTGASSDIEQATKRARAMVMKAGLSKELGPVSYGENEEEVFLGRSVARTQNMSEETARKVDAEIRKIVDKGYERARKVLTEKIDDLHKLAKALLTYETLSGEEIEDLINKNIYPSNKESLKIEEKDKGSALSSMGLKPKIVH
jgi:ATP-dependent Zn protease